MDRFKLVSKTAWAGIILNIVLLLCKLIVGIATQSQGMIADGLNSFGDVFASVTTLFGGRLASQPKDDEHPWGHGKAEYITSFIVALSMLLIAILTLKSAVTSLFIKSGFTFSLWLIATAILTIITKLSLFIVIRDYERKTESILIRAAAEDHRNDVFITLGTLSGVLAGLFNIFWLDAVVGAAISLWIAYTGIKILVSSLGVLMDSPLDTRFIDELKNRILEFDGVCHIDTIQSKPVGARYIVLIKISVPADMTVMESHSIAGKVRKFICDYAEVADAIVHINPVDV